ETLLDGDVPEEDARQFLSTVVRESERLGRLANDLIALQRIEGATGELPISRVDLLATARLAIAGLAPLTDGRGVSVTLEGAAPAVLGDADRLHQVFANLIDNASRMTLEGGTVTVSLSAEDGFAVARVLDEGPGISDADAARVFDRFYRAQPSRDRGTGGAGLGLAIVAAIVRSHAGTITAAAREGGGSVFTLKLPALPDED
ncbi:MAG: ATP-binding protein, partial [Actinomycetota bacterium]|nr:ATP-binding protein [Actinomycetota bacterium]